MDFKPFKIGKYLLLERLAMGGMAEVYRAKASGAGGFEKQLAIKRILPNYSQNPEFRRMFEYEARLSSMLQHANIVQIYDFVKSGDTYLLALEYIDGKNLRQFINKLKKVGLSLPVEYGVFVINEVCKGLDYAHKKKDDLSNRPLNIIHRDMSPQNVMLSYEGAVKIVDFGIAKAKDRVDETRSGVIKGKFGYMSPEQANGEPVDHKTDVFSTAIILWELLTGRRLFQTDNDMATLKLIQECVIPPPSKFNPKVTPDLEKIVMKGLTKDLSLRYQSAGNFHRNLQEFMNKFYPSFTQKDIGDTLGRVFKEEIESEKKRIEQLHRQSIPFSQGAKTDDEESDVGGQIDVPEGDQTESEIAGNTGVTQISEEIEEAAGNTGASEDFQYSDTLGSEANAIKADQSSLPSLTSASKARGQHFIDDETSISTMGQGLSWNEEAGGPQGNEAGTSEKTIVENDPSLSVTPTEEKSRPLEPISKSIARPAQSKQKTSTENSQISITSSPVRREPNRHFSAEPTGSNSMALENAKSNSRRRESSISHMRDFNAGNTGVSSAPSETGSLSLEEAKQPSYNTPVPRPQGRQQEDTENPYTREEMEVQSGGSRLKSVATFLFFSGLIAGTALLYQLYLGGGLLNLINKFVSTTSPREVTSPESGAPQAEEPPKADLGAEAEAIIEKPVGGCTLNIDSDPRGATVVVGKDENPSNPTTPTTVLLKCDTAADITLKKEGYDTISENIFVRGHNNKLYKTLRRIPTGTVELMVSQNANVEIKEIGLSRYLTVNEVLELSLRANRRYKVHFLNPVTGIDTYHELTVTDGARLRQKIQLLDDTRVPAKKD